MSTGAQPGAGVGGGGAALIADVTLASPASFVDLTAIPGNYKHLQLLYQLRSDEAATVNDWFALRLNGDAGANYDWFELHTVGGSAPNNLGLAADTRNFVGWCTQANATPNYFCVGSLLLFDYAAASSKFRTMTGYGSSVGGANTTWMYTWAGGGTWRSTAPINAIRLLPQQAGGNFVAGSRAMLYGL